MPLNMLNTDIQEKFTNFKIGEHRPLQAIIHKLVNDPRNCYKVEKPKP